MGGQEYAKTWRRVAVGILVLWVMGSADRADAAKLADDMNAFDGFVMKAPLSQYPSLKPLKTTSAEFVREIGIYEHSAQPITVNGVSFLKVRCRFADRRLESIELIYEGRENRQKLLQWLEEHYGKLSPMERKIVNQIEWYGELMTITLSYDSDTKQGTLWFISPELHALLHESTASMPD